MITGPLFNKILNCKKKNLVLQGGTSSAKTVSVLQALGTIATQEPKKIITITAQDLPTLKKGALRDFQVFVESDPEIDSHIQRYNKSDYTYTFKNKTIAEFTAFESEQKAKGSRRDYLYVNEGNGVQWNIFWQLQRRTRKMTIVDYNPTSKFWAHEKLLSGNDKEFKDRVQLYITDHRHNPFLTEDEHASIENISDPELFKVYARGMTGMIKGLIFGHFKSFPKVSLPMFKRGSQEHKAFIHQVGESAAELFVYDRIIFSLDYGYTNDPTALVKIYCIGKKRICQELCYETGLPAETIKSLLLFHGWQDGMAIYSEADPNMINQLRMLGMPVDPAIKGPGSVIAGLSKLREYDCYYTDDSFNFIKEIGMYKWIMAQDLATGKEVMTNIPVDAWNHLCDAARYGIYTDSFREV